MPSGTTTPLAHAKVAPVFHPAVAADSFGAPAGQLWHRYAERCLPPDVTLAVGEEGYEVADKPESSGSAGYQPPDEAMMAPGDEAPPGTPGTGEGTRLHATM